MGRICISLKPLIPRNHDIWDYDVPSQPAPVEFPDGKGGTSPGMVQTTERGQIFVLDRCTGQPLVKAEQKPAPAGAGTATGEYYAPTQPYSTGMAAIGDTPLTEARMWVMCAGRAGEVCRDRGRF